ncbi:MAG: response regulator [Candidatus Riflebacteria bacterium]|nr:response regulator [Candidatus Riflebacteria bacterium]
MKNLFRNMSISSKLTFIIESVTFVALLFFFATVTAMDSRNSRQTLENQITTLVKMAAGYCVSDLAFKYKQETEENLSTLLQLPDIEEVEIYNHDGNLFAFCTRSGAVRPTPPKTLVGVIETTVKFTDEGLEVCQPMSFRGKQHGTMRLVASTLTFNQMLHSHIGILGIFSAIVLLLAFFMALTVQRWISKPILDLVSKVQGITDGNLTIRVTVPESSGEIATLCQNVNLMADSLEHRMKEVEQAKQLLQLVTDHIPSCVFVKDKNLVYVWANRVFAQTLGFDSSENILGKTDYDFCWLKEESDHYRECDKRIMATDTPELHIIERLHHQNGTLSWVDTSKVPLHDENAQVIGVLGTFIDITDRILLEERLRQSEKLEAIGQLAGGVAHDFNNQLSGILGNAELILLKLADPEIHSFAKNIVAISLQAGELTQQLLAFARKGKVVSLPVNIHSVVKEVVALLKHSIDRRIVISQNLQADPSTTLGDPTQLQNALLNLAINARDAMPNGGELTFSTSLFYLLENTPKLELPTGRYLQIKITDTGLGMTKEVKNHLFEPFFTTKEAGKGTGLGLAAVYGAIKNHGGTISVYSEVGKGTTFNIFLPIVLSPEPKKNSENLTVTKTGNERILLVDDEEIVRETTQKILQSLGYQVTACRDGLEALEVFRSKHNQIDLVILDMVMPRMNGPETFQNMRAIHPGIKVLLASGFSLNGTSQKLLQNGVQGFLQKPFELSELSQKIREVLGENNSSSKN